MDIIVSQERKKKEMHLYQRTRDKDIAEWYCKSKCSSTLLSPHSLCSLYQSTRFHSLVYNRAPYGASFELCCLRSR